MRLSDYLRLRRKIWELDKKIKWTIGTMKVFGSHALLVTDESIKDYLGRLVDEWRDLNIERINMRYGVDHET